MASYTEENVVSVLEGLKFNISTQDSMKRVHAGYVVFTMSEEDRTAEDLAPGMYIRYEEGVEAQGKRVNEVLGKNEARINEAAEYLSGSLFSCHIIENAVGKFTAIHITAYNGPEFVVEKKKFDRDQYQKERQETEREKRKKQLGYGEDGSTPLTVNYGNRTIEVGKYYVLEGGHNRYKGRVVKIKELMPIGGKCTVTTSRGIDLKVRLLSIGEERESYTPFAPTPNSNGTGTGTSASAVKIVPNLPTIDTDVLASLVLRIEHATQEPESHSKT